MNVSVLYNMKLLLLMHLSIAQLIHQYTLQVLHAIRAISI